MTTAQEMLSAKGDKVFSVSKDSTLFNAIKIMNDNHIGAILIKENERVIGIWTERDLLKNTMEENFDPRTAVIADYMVTDLKYAGHDETLYQLQDKFLGMRLRHMLIQKDGQFLGMLSAGDVMKSLLNKKQKELSDINAMVGWEYYDNWRWDKKKYS